MGRRLLFSSPRHLEAMTNATSDSLEISHSAGSGAGQGPASPPASTHISVSLFGIAVGVLALGNAWRAASGIWSVPKVLPLGITLLGLGVWLLVAVAYACAWHVDRVTAKAELEHPVHSSLAALGPISTLLASIALLPASRAAAEVVFAVGIVAQLTLGLWIHGRFWQGGTRPESVSPALYLPTVAQNFVASAAASAFGWSTAGALFFGIGAFSWLALESMVVSRAALHSPILEAHRPLHGIQIAPAVVGGLSYLGMTDGAPDLLAQMLMGYGLYQAALALRLLPWIGRQPFLPSYWAFSFGVVALATMALKLHARAPDVLTWRVLAPVLFGGANLILGLLIVRTVWLTVSGRLLGGRHAAHSVAVELPNAVNTESLRTAHLAYSSRQAVEPEARRPPNP